MNSDHLKPFFTWLHLHPNWAGLAVFFISLIESLAVVGLLIPGSVMMTAVGGLIGSGILPGSLTIIWAILGAVAGDNASYWLGHHYHEHIRQIWPFKRYPKLLENGTHFFKQHGGKSVFLGRFVGPVRPMIPLIAGMMNMSPWQFMLANISSAIAWAPAYMLPGILLGAASAEVAPETATHILIFVVVALLILWCISWLLKRLCTTLLKSIDYLITSCWKLLRTKTNLTSPYQFFFKPIYRLLQLPKQPENHSQLTLAFSAAILTTTFLILTYSVTHKGLLIRFDSPVYHLLRSLHTPAMTQIMIGITFLGQSHVIAALVAGLAIWFLYKRDWFSLSHWLVLSVTCYGLTESLKRIFKIARPGDLIHNPSSWSFPSGHAALTSGILGFLAVLLALHLKPGLRRVSYYVASISIFSVALSRIFLGAHWLSDILGGILLGLTLCLLTTISYRKYHAAKPNQTFSITAIIIITIFSLSSAWMWYFLQHFHQALYSYTPYSPQKTLVLNEWWQTGDPQASIYRLNRTGKPVQILNVQWAGDLNSIDDELEQSGWQPLPKISLLTLASRITGSEHGQHFPLLSPLYQDKKPLLVMVKHVEVEHALLVLRLWDDQTVLNQHKIPLWIGTISYYHPWKLPLLHKSSATNKKQALPPAQNILEGCLNNYEWRKLYYPQANLLNTRENTDWQGYILLIRPKGQS